MINKNEAGLILVRETKFDKIRRKLLIFFWGKDYKIIQNFDELFKVNRPKDIIIPKPIKRKEERV